MSGVTTLSWGELGHGEISSFTRAVVRDRSSLGELVAAAIRERLLADHTLALR
jgi:hypothetical protein